jgi:uncharacterized membrane protein
MADFDNLEQDLSSLREVVRKLTQRVHRIEQALGTGARDSVEAAPEQAAEVPGPPIASSIPSSRAAEPATPAPPGPSRPALTSTSGYFNDSGTAMSAPHVDLESRIGSHWLNRIGIAAVLIGVAYFLKYAFDNNWIGPAGRVTIGLLAGIAVVIWSERFRNKGYRLFSYSLKAVGIGVLYLSLWAAFQVYHLVPNTAAFFAMLAVTGATATLAWVEDAEILAAFSLVGGFVTPVLLSTGENRELQLFSYLVLLDLAALVLVTLKPWRRLLVVSFLGTLSLYMAWYAQFYNRTELRLTIGFATLFFAIFAIAPLIARAESESGVLSTVPHFVAFLNAGVYFLQVYDMLETVDKTATAWFALALAAIYVFLSRQAQARNAEPVARQTLHFLHLALAIGFITVAIPIRLNGHWITMGWFVEAAVLLWVADRIHSEFLNGFALGALILGVLRLLFIDNFHPETLIVNWRMAVFVVAIAVLGLVAWYGSKREDDVGRSAVVLSVVALNLLTLIALSREVADYFMRQMAAANPQPGQWVPGAVSETRSLEIARDFTFSALWMAYGAMLMIVGFWRRSAFVRWQALVLIAVTIAKVFTYDVSELERGYRIVSFIVLGALLLAISFVYQRDWLKLSRKAPEAQ